MSLFCEWLIHNKNTGIIKKTFYFIATNSGASEIWKMIKRRTFILGESTLWGHILKNISFYIDQRTYKFCVTDILVVPLLLSIWWHASQYQHQHQRGLKYYDGNPLLRGLKTSPWLDVDIVIIPLISQLPSTFLTLSLWFSIPLALLSADLNSKFIILADWAESSGDSFAFAISYPSHWE